MKWKPKRSSEGGVVPTCWVTDSDYLVAEVRNTAKGIKRYIVSRPGGTTPFACLEDRDEVIEAIEKDMRGKDQ